MQRHFTVRLALTFTGLIYFLISLSSYIIENFANFVDDYQWFELVYTHLESFSLAPTDKLLCLAQYAYLCTWVGDQAARKALEAYTRYVEDVGSRIDKEDRLVRTNHK